MKYIENDSICKQLQLLNYFGEDAVETCGMCSVCLANSESTKSVDLKTIQNHIISTLTHKNCNSRQLVERITISMTLISLTF